MKDNKHKNIGILGGMGMDSTILMQRFILDEYYQNFNAQPPHISFFIVNLKKLLDLQFNEEWDSYASYLNDCIDTMKESGCDFVSIAAVTPHIVFDKLRKTSKIPLLNIFDSSTDHLGKQKGSSVLLLGTSFTVNSRQFEKKIQSVGKEVILPNKLDQEYLDSVIYRSLVQGETNEVFKNEINRLIDRYACDSVVLGCTDLSLVYSKHDTGRNLINSLKLHAKKTLYYALNE